MQAVENAILACVNGLPDRALLPYSRLAMVAYMVDPFITNVTGVALNGGTADLVPGLFRRGQGDGRQRDDQLTWQDTQRQGD